jgi:hypothetical protein
VLRVAWIYINLSRFFLLPQILHKRQSLKIKMKFNKAIRRVCVEAIFFREREMKISAILNKLSRESLIFFLQGIFCIRKSFADLGPLFEFEFQFEWNWLFLSVLLRTEGRNEAIRNKNFWRLEADDDLRSFFQTSMSDDLQNLFTATNYKCDFIHNAF